MVFDVRSAMRSSAGLVAVTALVLLVAACGRRGPLEAPPDASVTAKPAARSDAKASPATRRVQAPPAPPTFGSQTQAGTQDTADDETEDAPDSFDATNNVVLNPTPAPPGTRKRGRSYTVPKEPFILDPLL